MKTKRKKNKNLIHISKVIQQTLGTYRCSTGEDTKIDQIWKNIIGGQIAVKTRPGKLKNGVLTIYSESAGWLQELRYLKADLLQKINTELGTKTVIDFNFKIGQIN